MKMLMMFPWAAPNIAESTMAHSSTAPGEWTLSFPLKNAWILAGKYHAEAQRAEATNLDFSKCDSWRCFLIDVRTFFEQNPLQLFSCSNGTGTEAGGQKFLPPDPLTFCPPAGNPQRIFRAAGPQIGWWAGLALMVD